MESNYYISKRTAGKQFVYEVWHKDQKIGQRRSPRTYVACAGTLVGGTPYIRNWFGRKDLIGKGESGRYLGSPVSFVALLKEENEEKPSTDTERIQSGPTDSGEGPGLE